MQYAQKNICMDHNFSEIEYSEFKNVMNTIIKNTFNEKSEQLFAQFNILSLLNYTYNKNFKQFVKKDIIGSQKAVYELLNYTYANQIMQRCELNKSELFDSREGLGRLGLSSIIRASEEIICFLSIKRNDFNNIISIIAPFNIKRKSKSAFDYYFSNDANNELSNKLFIKDLNKIFSSWELALAAYNSGENGMIRRIMKYGTSDFYKLSQYKKLPSETINYVPKVLAAMHILNNAKEYGFVIPTKKHRLFDLTELTPVKKNVSLHVIANRLNVDYRLIKKLNPELKKSSTPRHFSGTYMLRIPKSQYAYKLEDLKTNIIASTTPSSKLSRPESRKEISRRTALNTGRPSFYRAKKGDTLLSISRRFEISPKLIASLNNFKSWKSKVKIGQKITLNSGINQNDNSNNLNPVVKITNRPIVYKVTKGDSLDEIAKLFDSPLSKLKKVNNIKRGKILVGQKLVLPGTQKGIYTVKNGDHLTKVAKNFNLKIETLVKINSLKRRTIYPGQKIIVNMD
jgi:LysM repeat protein